MEYQGKMKYFFIILLVISGGCDKQYVDYENYPAWFTVNDKIPVDTTFFNNLKWNVMYSDFANLNNVAMPQQTNSFDDYGVLAETFFSDDKSNKINFDYDKQSLFKSATGYTIDVSTGCYSNKFGTDKYYLGSYIEYGILNDGKIAKYYMNKTKIRLYYQSAFYKEVYIWGKFKIELP